MKNFKISEEIKKKVFNDFVNSSLWPNCFETKGTLVCITNRTNSQILRHPAAVGIYNLLICYPNVLSLYCRFRRRQNEIIPNE